jgi:putative ABC transport system permease protein
VYLYGWRLRAHPFQELFATIGIAIGVALLFAVQIANTSITGSVEQLLHAITGRAQLELAARDEQGFDQRLLGPVRKIPGVITAAPTLERRAVLVGPAGSEAIALIGVDVSLAALDGAATRDFGPGRLMIPSEGILLPDRLARVAGVAPGGYVRLEVAGRVHRVRVAAALTKSQIGSLTESSVAIAPLGFAQQLAGMPQRLTRILVHADERRQPLVEMAMTAMSAGRLDVGAADSTIRRLESATAPNDQSTALFSAISAMVGLLFAFNAMLLTMPERRAFVTELRMQGFTPAQVIAVLGFQALVLGVTASIIGLGLGDILSRTVFHSLPTYLAFSFPIGMQRVVPIGAVLLSFGAGIGASLLAACRPLRDVFSRRPVDAVYEERGELGQGLDASLRRTMLRGSLAIVTATTLVVTLLPRTTIVGVMALGVALLLAIPAAFAATLPLLERAARSTRRNLLLVAAMGTRSAMTRSIAVAAIAAIAVFGSVAIGGARNDLVRGLGAGFTEQAETADVWITTGGRSLTTDDFPITRRELAQLRAAPEIETVRIYQGGMLDLPDRRVWVVARPPDDAHIIPASQLVSGDPLISDRRMGSNGWAAVSGTIADELDVGVGDAFELPTPSGSARLRLAAIVTNLGWGSGAIILNTRDYSRYWETNQASAIGVGLAPDVTPLAGKHAVTRALDPSRALDVESAREFEQEFVDLLHEGLTRLSQISTLLLIAATLALAAAMSAATWQRRQQIAAYKVQGFRQSQLRRILMLESVLVLLLGCAVGAAMGAYGHALGNRWLQLMTGFPAPFSLQAGQALTTLAAVLCSAAVIVAVTGMFAVRVPPGASFRE